MNLDCENRQSVIESLMSIYRINENELTDTLLSMNVREHYLAKGHEMMVPMKGYLFNLFTEKHGLPENLTTVCWFHSTRTIESNNFVEGVLPLGDSLPLVWDMLIDNAPNKQISDDLSELRSSGKMSSAFNGKIAKPIDAGPFATLVKDLIFHLDDLPFHDYIGMPEIVEDIIASYPQNQGADLRTHYEDVLVPKTVKFKVRTSDNDPIATALNYASDCVWGVPPRGWTNACYDSDGQPISPDQILKVETCRP